jgi:hypothetical protein
MLRQPALGGVDLTVLFLVSALGHDKLGFQRQDVGIARLRHDRGEHTVKVLEVAIAQNTLTAIQTMELLRREILGAIEHHQELPSMRPEPSSTPALANA